MKISIEQFAAAQGFELRHAGPEPAVLPLDDAAHKKPRRILFRRG